MQHLEIILSVVGTVLLLLLTVIGFFGKRLLQQTDDAIATAQAQNAQLSTEVQTLTNALENTLEEMRHLRTEVSVFRRAFAAWDKWIYGESQHGTFKNRPPNLSPLEPDES